MRYRIPFGKKNRSRSFGAKIEGYRTEYDCYDHNGSIKVFRDDDYIIDIDDMHPLWLSLLLPLPMELTLVIPRENSSLCDYPKFILPRYRFLGFLSGAPKEHRDLAYDVLAQVRKQFGTPGFVQDWKDDRQNRANMLERARQQFDAEEQHYC